MVVRAAAAHRVIFCAERKTGSVYAYREFARACREPHRRNGRGRRGSGGGHLQEIEAVRSPLRSARAGPASVHTITSRSMRAPSPWSQRTATRVSI